MTAPFKVGDKVISDLNQNEKEIIRTVIVVRRDKQCASGWNIRADGGEKCKHCQRPYGTPTWGDSSWFILIPGEVSEENAVEVSAPKQG